MHPAHVIGLSTLGVGVLVAVICVPLMRDRIPMNPYYGFRFARSMESEELWYAINRYGARRMFGWSLVLVVLGGLLLVAPAAVAAPLLPVALWAPLLMLVPALQAFRYARSLPPSGHR